jgi:hypothetical protein
MAIETGTAEYWLDLGVGREFPHNLDFSLNEELMRALEVRKSFLVEYGFLQTDFDLAEWTNPQPLESALKRVTF